MYQLAAQRLDIAPHHILHVGDDLTTDVAGSLRCGLQACWINLRQGNLMHIPDASANVRYCRSGASQWVWKSVSS